MALLDSAYEQNRQSLSIIRLVGAHCPDLMSFHLSMSRRFRFGLGSREIVSILATFPLMEECNLTDELFSLNLLMALHTSGFTNRITTLNFLPTEQNALQPKRIPLREILCSFNHLIHLRAPTAIYIVEDMDLHDILDQLYASNPYKNFDFSRGHRHNPTNDPAFARKYIWVCRGLKTLHMTVGHRESDTRSSYTAESVLILFGFLSRMAPQLQELYLKIHSVNLTFEGGLALLTRLGGLERIRIGMDLCPWWYQFLRSRN